MNVWELRQMVESHIPAWVPLIVIFVVSILMAYIFSKRGAR